MKPALFFVADGYRARVTNMFDIDGDDTDSPDDAHSCVAELPDGQWLAIECRKGDIVENSS